VLGGQLSSSDVTGKISVAAKGQSDVVSVTATDPSPPFAARLANLYADQYIAFRQSADRSKIYQARQLVQNQLDGLTLAQRQSPNGQSLAQRAEQLSVLAALQTGNAELVQPASLPTSPSAPLTKRNTILGGLLGLLLGVLLALGFERIDRRLRSPDEMAEAYRLPLLGTVPQARALAVDSDSASPLPPAASEAFRMLRGRMRYFNVDRDIRSVLVTSPAPRDGKSTIAWNLARTAAMSPGARVLLVETDFRRPVLAHNHGLRPVPGLAEALTHGVAVEDVILKVTVREATPQTAEAVLEVIPAGAPPPNPTELIESHKMADLLTDFSASYDLVIVDTPPSSVVPDAFPLMRRVSGVIVVSSLDQTTRDAAVHLRDQLTALEAHPLGVIANRVKVRRDSYYGYGYYQRPGGEAPDAVSNGSGGARATAEGNGAHPEDGLAASGSPSPSIPASSAEPRRRSWLRSR